MNIEPLRDRVVVKPLKKTGAAPGSLIEIPATAAEKPMEGEVIAIGPGKMLDNGQVIALSVKPGDKVIYGKYSGTEIKINSDDLVVMREDDIMGIIK